MHWTSTILVSRIVFIICGYGTSAIPALKENGKDVSAGETNRTSHHSKNSQRSYDHGSVGYSRPRQSSATCVDIPTNLSLCHGIGYSQMRLPNLLEHETLGEVTRNSGAWAPLVATGCSSNTQLFLCSLFSPVCLDQVIYPCRSLCLTVKAGCENTMKRFGFPWPEEMLGCEQFPLETDLCISPQPATIGSGNATTKAVDGKSAEVSACPACMNSTLDYTSILAYYCSADFVAKVTPELKVVNGNNLKITTGKKTKFFKSNPTTSISQHPGKPRHIFHLPNGANCDCNGLNPKSRSSDSTEQYLFMGHQLDKDRLTLTFAIHYDPKLKALHKALRAFGNDEICVESDNQKAVKGKNRGGEKQSRKRIKKRNKMQRNKKLPKQVSDKDDVKPKRKNEQRKRKINNRNDEKSKNSRYS